MERICRISKILRIIFISAVIAIPLGQAFMWISLPATDGPGLNCAYHFMTSANLDPSTPVPASIRLLGFMITMLTGCLHMAAFFTLFLLFGLYTRAEIFTAQAVGHIRRIGYILLAVQAVGPLRDALLSYVLPMHNPIGQRTISVGFSSTDLNAIIIAVLVIVVSWIMNEGRKIKEEEALVI